jgi:phosphate:Na+ symporter
VAPTTGAELAVWPLLAGLLGGLALFLLGLDQLTGSLRSASGDGLKAILSRMSRNPGDGCDRWGPLDGVLQSSSVTTVLVIGFVSAGVLSLQQAAGIIIGANLGSTATAQVIAFDVARFSLARSASGSSRRRWPVGAGSTESGTGLLGLGLIFFGMSVMGDAVSPCRTIRRSPGTSPRSRTCCLRCWPAWCSPRLCSRRRRRSAW